MSYFDDGWVDERSAAPVDRLPAEQRDADTVRREIEGFRGKVLSAAYGLERDLDALIVWHLFLNRQDGMAAFFEESILGDLGLERKLKLARKIALEWNVEDMDAFAKSIARTKDYRDRVAHWPTRLQPLLSDDGKVVDYRVHMTKGDVSLVMDRNIQGEWLKEIASARAKLDAIVVGVREAARSGIFDD